MDKKNSEQPAVCGCGCGCLLSTDHLRGRIYVQVEGKSVLINMTCYNAAYGKGGDTISRSRCGCGAGSGG